VEDKLEEEKEEQEEI